MPKQIGDKVYVHISAEGDLSRELRSKITLAKSVLPESWFFNIIKVSTKTDEVSFIYCAGFDAFDEPALHSSVKVKGGVCSKIRYESRDNPTIYHGKHFFVRPDYNGFDVRAAKRRYEAWKKSGIPEVADVSKIGRLRYWNDIALPKLRNMGVL